ncbi:MAG: hypothetical protein SYC29_15345 [Planctomycetota bacterium]|nr:hypothetical protein [Planctomycetota bacterium]
MFRLGAILFPLMILAMILKQKGPVWKFLRIGATSPDTARRADSAELTAPDRLHLEDLVKRGVLVALDDGRYYVDLAVHRRRRRMLVFLLAVVAMALVAGVLLLWPTPEA